MVKTSISRTQLSRTYDAARPAAMSVDPGSTVTFECADARDGEFAHVTAGSSFDLTSPPAAGSNPLTGPLEVVGAEPGDTLVVDVVVIAPALTGWIGAHSNSHVLPGQIATPGARMCAVGDHEVELMNGIRLRARPMVGCIGVAPAGEALAAGTPGRHGGNLDHPTLTTGSRIHLPVAVPGALLYIGDLHAAQGDGELSGIAVEVAGEVTVTVTLTKHGGLAWPWLETSERIAVLTCGETFEEARSQAVGEMVTLIGDRLSLEPGEALALLSAAADIRIGQAAGGMPLTLRLEMPRLPGLSLGAA